MSALQQVDIAFVALLLFVGFFFSIVFYLRREDRREGYPLEEDDSGVVRAWGSGVFIPPAKTFQLAAGRGTRKAPSGLRDTRPLALRRSSVVPGSPSDPTGNPLVDGVGPASYAQRPKVPDIDTHGRPKIVPLRSDSQFSIVRQDVDPRGKSVYGADGKVAGKVADVWVDRPESMIRYLEIALPSGANVLAPMPMARITEGGSRVTIDAITAAQFADVPRIAGKNEITMDEEERISAYYGGGYLYATPDRMEPLL